MTQMFGQRLRPITIALGLALAAAAPAFAQAQAPPPTPPATDDPTLRFRMPTVTVTARRDAEDKQKAPVSVTAVSSDALRDAAVRIVSDAAIVAPNTFFIEWSARKLSSARVRGIGSSPGNPGITTFIDGVPQLNANSSSADLLDVERIEFVRGPQSALFGRNTLGGLVSVTSARPSVSDWSGAVSAPVGNYGAWGVAGSASGALVRNRAGLSVSFAQVSRDGFTIDDVSGRRLDDRSGFSAKAQLLWLPSDAWEARLIVSGERARDGEYSLQDVGALRSRPFHAARDFIGSVDRDVLATTLLLRRARGPIVFESTTGLVDWRTHDLTDLDYTPLPLLRRDNREDDRQFTQEVRVASAEQRPLVLGASTRLRWQGGVFLFTQDYEQDAVNSYAANVVAPFPLTQHTPRSVLDDVGVGLFGQGTFTFGERLDVSAGARFDYEDRNATLETFFDPAIAPPVRVDVDRRFSNVSPQASLAYRLASDRTVYATVGRGFKAGGFNPASPPGAEAYGEELTWHVEGGVKTGWAANRVTANLAVFHIDWDDLQLDVPNPAAPAQFYVANVGGARSRGVEVELAARAAPGLDLYSAFGYTHARFASGSRSGGVDVAGKTIPNAPDYTFSMGAQYQRTVGQATIVGRADAVFYGAFQYNDVNTLGQDAYSLVNLRLGVTGRVLFGEVLVRNAFDTRYIPVAFAYPNFAPSGFIGEMGAPRTVSIRAGVRF